MNNKEKRIRKAYEKILKETGTAPRIKDIAKLANVSIEEVKTTLVIKNKPLFSRKQNWN